MNLTWLKLFLMVLATYRLTRLLNKEEGPKRICHRIRQCVPDTGPGSWGEGLRCPYCCSMWVGAVFAWLSVRFDREQVGMKVAKGRGLIAWVLLTLGLSGGSIILTMLLYNLELVMHYLEDKGQTNKIKRELGTGFFTEKKQ